jgi:hypothetical protein
MGCPAQDHAESMSADVMESGKRSRRTNGVGGERMIRISV